MMLDMGRLTGAAVLLGLYAWLCWRSYLIWRSRRAPIPASDFLIVFASQTGTAELYARQTQQTLELAGLKPVCLPFDALRLPMLEQAQRVLFIVSTYGEGDAPDMAAHFEAAHMAAPARLAQAHFGLMALGDTSYRQYRHFGLALDRWMRASGASPLFERVDVDCSAPAAIATWRHHLSHLAGTSDAPDWSAPASCDFVLQQRVLLNAGSAGAPVYALQLAPADGVLPAWDAGDLVQICPPSEPDRPREYSIASMPAEGAIALLLRLHQREDGSLGRASGWLCRELAVGQQLSLQVREHQRFRQAANAALPCIFIGNGTGIAGLRAHLTKRIESGCKENWLIFGERNAAYDLHYSADVQAWLATGDLARLDLAWSRDAAQPTYVQHILAQQASLLRQWVARGAAIYVCGSLEGMAAAVQSTLADILSADQVQQLAHGGRYRRDVY